MTTKLSFKPIILAGAKAAGVAALINAFLFFVFHALGIIKETVFIQSNEPLTVPPVILSSIFPPLLGAIVFYLFEKYTDSGYKIFRFVAIVLLVLSFASPFMAVAGMPFFYALVLCLMHTVVASSLLCSISKVRRGRSSGFSGG
jgi:Family of unknown function (DUF6069)